MLKRRHCACSSHHDDVLDCHPGRQLFVLAGWLLADDVAEQAYELQQTLPRAISNLSDRIGASRAGRLLLDQLPAGTPTEQLLSQVAGAVSATVGTTLTLLTNVIVIVFVALYTALDPGLYARGVVALMPHARRQRAREVLQVLGTTLRRWLKGQEDSAVRTRSRRGPPVPSGAPRSPR